MRLALQSMLVLCPFILSSLCAEDDEQSYYLEEEVADEESTDANFYDVEEVAEEESYAEPYSLDEIADDEEDSESMHQESSHSMKKTSGNCRSPFHVMNAGIRHTEARGIGYKSGYTTLEGFGIYDHWNHFMPFLDLRGHVFNDGKFAGNIGIGERTALFSISHFLGTYLYYDVRQDRHGLTVNQLSPGIELVGSRMEYRVNGYFPLGNTKSRKYGTSFDKFHDHNIILRRKQREALTGGDAEVGVHITQSTKYDLYAAAGTYYFSASEASSWGGRARLLGRYKEYVTLEASYSYDHLFRSIVQGTVGVNLPFGAKLKRRDKNCGEGRNLWFSRAAFAPQRFEIPVIKRVKRHSKAINPATGKPWSVWFVNNTSHSNGTYESPFSTLVNAQNASSANEMIYVFSGDGTTTGMNQGITLKAGQLFFGSGTKQHFVTTLGSMTIPVMTKNNPSITNASGNVVTVASSNTVSGFNISYTGSNTGIISPVSGISNAKIINNSFASSSTGSGSNAISLFGAGRFIIDNNQLTQMSPAGKGIVLTPVYGTMQGEIKSNIINGVQTAVALNSTSTQGMYDFTIEQNSITNANPSNLTTSGMTVFLTGASKVNISDNSITIKLINTDSALAVIDDTTSVSPTARIVGNQIVSTSAATQVIGLNVSIGQGLDVFRRITVTNNSITIGSTDSSSNAYFFSAQNGPSQCLSLDNNISINATGSTAFRFLATSGSVINIDSIENNVGGPVSATGANLVAPGTCGN